MVRAASQRLCPFQVDTSRCIGVEIKPANVRQDLSVSMAGREFAKAASLVVDAEFKVVAWAGLYKIVDEIFRKFFLMAFGSLLAVPETERLASGRQFMSSENQTLLREQAASGRAVLIEPSL